MALTVRLPGELQIEANRYAGGLGLSLNSLIAVALREYLDDRKRPDQAVAAQPAPSVMPADIRPAPVAPVAPAPRAAIVAPANRRAPCPCGSGKRYSQCHGAPDARP